MINHSRKLKNRVPKRSRKWLPQGLVERGLKMRREYSHKTSSCHGSDPRENKLNPRRALWHNQYRHRAPGSVKFRTGGHSPRTALAGRQKIVRIFASAQDAKTPLEKPARKRGRTGENPVPTVQSGWKVARAEKGRSALRRTSRGPSGQRAGCIDAVAYENCYSRAPRFSARRLSIRQRRGAFRRCRYVIPLDRSR